jgi:DNA-directed RNA polymerase subunit F
MKYIYAEELKNKKMIIYGASEGGKNAYYFLKIHNKVICFADSNPSKWHNYHCNLLIIPPSEILFHEYDYVVVSSMFQDEIISILKSNNLDENKIALVQPETIKDQRGFMADDNYYKNKEVDIPNLKDIAEWSDKNGNIRLAAEIYRLIHECDESEGIYTLPYIWSLLMEIGVKEDAQLIAQQIVDVCPRTSYWFKRLIFEGTISSDRKAAALLAPSNLAISDQALNGKDLAIQIQNFDNLQKNIFPKYLCVTADRGLAPSNIVTLDVWAKTVDQGVRTIAAADIKAGSIEWPDKHWVPHHVALSPLAPTITFLVKEGYEDIQLFGDFAISAYDEGRMLKDSMGKRNIYLWADEAMSTARLLIDCEEMNVHIYK